MPTHPAALRAQRSDGTLGRLLALGCVLAASLATMQAADRAAPLHNVDGSFVRDWLVLGPFASRDMETDLLASAGGEANVRPKEGDTVATKEGRRLVWTRLRSKYDVIDLEEAPVVRQWAIVYAYCELNSDRSVETDVRAPASWHPALLWFNGKKVGEMPLMPVRKDELNPTMPIRLRAGRNSCLLKLKLEAEPPWTFAFQPLYPDRAKVELRVTDPKGRPISGGLIQVYDQSRLVARMQTDASGEAAVCLYPLARSYDLRLTSGELGTWVNAPALRPGEERKLAVALTNAVSISGQTLTMNGSPQHAIVVQALHVTDLPNHGSPDAPPSDAGAARLGRPMFTWEPQLNDGSYSPVQSLLPMPAFSETVLSDTNGNFRFVNLRPGRYRLRAHGSRGYVYPEGARGPDLTDPILVEPGRTHDGTRFVFARAKKGVWTRYPIRNGLADLPVRSIHRTPDGMLWVGTNLRTLHSYDGVEFKMFSPPEIRGNYVRVLDHDAKGTLWIGTDMGISRLLDGRIQTPTFNESLRAKDVGSMVMDADGTVWFSTPSGLCKYDGRQFVRWTMKEGLPSNEIGGLMRARDGGLWMSTSRGLARFDGRSFSEPVLLNEIRSPGWERLYQAKDDAIWFCSPAYAAAAFRYDGKTLSRLGEAEGLLSDQINKIAETSDGALWFATNKGLSRFDGTTILNYTVADGLAYGEVGDIYVDSDDVLWCACRAGVSRFDPNGFAGVNIDDGLRNKDGVTPGVFAIEPDTEGGYLIGTEWGGAQRLDNRLRQLATNSVLLVDGYVRHIQRSADGTWWFGTADGIYKQASGRVTRILKRNWIIALNSQDPGELWFGQGWIGGGLSRYNLKTGEETVFTRAQGLPDDTVWALERGLDGSVWIGTGDGLAQFRDGKIENVGERLGIPHVRVMSLRRDAEGTLWIGGGTGLYRLRGTNLVSIAASNQAPASGIWCSARTADGILWMGTDGNGLLGYDGTAETMIDKRDGLLGNQVFTVRPDGNESLLLGFVDGGLSRYRRTKSAPSVRFMEVKFEDQTLSDLSNLPFTEIGKRVSVQYQEIDLKTLPDKRQFRYRVEGPSGKLLFAGVTKDRRFEWTPREGGNYRLEVQAIDRDLNYSTPARLTFHTTVPWYANAWIIVPGSGMMGGLVIWAFVAGAIYVRQRREAERLREQMLRQERQAREALEDKTRQLAKAKEEADTANRAKSAFLASMSHEIRTPLNAIMGYAQILRRKPDLPADERAAVKTIESSGDHLLTLINSVLDLSKIEAGSMDLDLADFDLTKLVHEIAAMFQFRCQEKGLEWRVEFECEGRSSTESELAAEKVEKVKKAERATNSQPSHPSSCSRGTLRLPSDVTPDRIPVRGDEGKLRQVLINLLGNAVKFTDSGHVTLRVARPNGRSGSPEANPNESRLSQSMTFLFEIIDSGPGIPGADQKSLFAPFVQVGDGARKGGTGLGLAISRRLAELMGGRIGLRSAAGEGSTFSFTVPLAPASAGVEEQAFEELKEPSHLAAGCTVNALIVDDVEQNRAVLFQLLASLGCEVRLAESGERALELIRVEIPDIVFTDIRMPAMDGFELKTKIVKQFGPGRMRLVAISASVLAHEQQNYLQRGFDDFVGKPFRVARIAACLARLLPVEFHYAPPEDTLAASKMGEPLGEARVVLPGPLLARLRASAKSYRMVELRRCLVEVEQLGAEGRRLAAALEALNQKGEMEKILEILQSLDR